MPPEPDDSFDFLPGTTTQQTPQPLPKKREDFPFLIADHAFDAHSLDAEKHQRDPQAICLSFSRHELAYVHFVHPSGWGDVTLVKSGERGWIPIDYFSGFSDQRAISLLAAIAAFLAQPRSQKLYIAPQRVHTFSEAAINEIISGTKLLLTRTGVLSRDAHLVMTFPAIAVARKSLLTELAHLVHVAKHNKHSADPEVIEKLLRGCYRLLERTLTLLTTVDANQGSINGRDGPNIAQINHTRSTARSGDRSDSSSRNSSRNSRLSRHSSNVSTQSGFSDLDGHNLYRMNSFTDYSTPPLPEPRLYEVTNAFNSYLSRFLDPQDVLLADPESPSTPSLILSLTRHCMLACRELLVVLDLVPDGLLTDGLGQDVSGKDELLEEIRRLVSGARSVVAALPPSPASLRAAAAQNMANTASKCQVLAMTIAQTSLQYLRDHPDLELPNDRSYPLFLTEGDDRNNFSESHPVDIPKNRTVSSHDKVEKEDTHKNGSLSPKSSVVIPNRSDSGNATNFSNDSKVSMRSSKEIRRETQIVPVHTPAAQHNAESLKSTEPLRNISKHSSQTQLSPRKTRQPKRREHSIDRSIDHSLNTSVDLSANEHASPEQSVNTSVDTSMDTSGFSNQFNDSTDTIETELVMRNGRVRGGSLTALLRWLTGDDYTNLEFEIRAFLLTFRLFTTPRDVVIELGSTDTPGVQHFVTRWIESFWEPGDNILSSLKPMAPQSAVLARQKFDEDGKHNVQLVDLPIQPYDPSTRSFSNASTSSVATISAPRRNTSFTTQFASQFTNTSTLNIAASFRDLGLGSRRASRQASIEDDDAVGRSRAPSNAFEPMSSSAVSSDAVDVFLSKPVADLAQQLTLMWFDIFRQLRPSELLDQRFSSSKKRLGLSPHVTQLVLSSNHLTAFVGDTILSPELSTKQRGRVLKHWVRMADELYNIGNLNGTVTIVLTLQSTRIVRLSKAWESLGNKSQQIFGRLIPLTSPERNFNEYRRELHSRQGQPCLPYMGILLGDLTFIDEGNPKVLKATGAINFDRYRKSAMAIAGIQPFQKSVFPKFQPDVAVQSWLRSQMARSHSQDTKDANEQWRRSLLIQPEE